MRMRFEWDEAKRQSNRAKQGVDFADAAEALLDERAKTIEDPDAEGERRYLTVGLDPTDQVLLVVWTEQGEDVIRIVSARRASPGERRAYSTR